MIILVRHGQTQANADGLLLGRSDPPLTALGELQASAVAAVISGVPHVVTSPLKRARRTAEVIAAGAEVEVDDRWVEIDYGELELMPLRAVPNSVWDQWRRDPDFAPGGGESLSVVGSRVRAAIEDVADRAAREDVVVVSHVSPIKAAVAWAVGAGDAATWRMFLDVASICRIGVGATGPSLRSFNDRAHLGGVSS